MKRRGWMLLTLLSLMGCAAKKPVNVRYVGCKVTTTWTDEQGNTRKDCDCHNGKQIGWDARTGAALIRCVNEFV